MKGAGGMFPDAIVAGEKEEEEEEGEGEQEKEEEEGEEEDNYDSLSAVNMMLAPQKSEETRELDEEDVVDYDFLKLQLRHKMRGGKEVNIKYKNIRFKIKLL